ncbi:hypothetical protein [Acidisphaera sp. S103]|uniref:hypothetical protein n=1 Tax=Acidisphaera sp. S103 TaxID=1747223 RepID=UPI00131D1354|nr:hypothetical protein [Acidisphaera sp. S103]
MTVDREAAASSLAAIEHVERRTARAVFYGIASAFMILWGVITAAGYCFTQAYPARAAATWPILNALGLIATVAMTARNSNGLMVTSRRLSWRLVYAQLALIGFGIAVVTVLGPFRGRQLDAFWPLLFMLGYVLTGIWIGRFFVLCGLVVALLIVVGFWWAGPWFQLWMAVVDGGALILGGLWLRRQGAAL